MAAVTEDSNVVLKAPVAPSASFDAIKQKGIFGWDETYQTLTVCPVDGGDYKRLGLHPDSAPLASSLNSTDTILISVGGTLKRTTVQAIGGGGTWQPLDSDLTAIAALTTQAFGRSLLTQADAVAVRALIGAPAAADLAGYQPLDSDLTAIAALTTTAFGRSVLTQVDAAAVRTLIGAGTSSFNGAYTSLTSIPAAIDALDNLTPAADRLPYFTNGTTAALATFSAFARTLVDDADAATARATLGAGTVSSVALSLPAIFTVSGSPVTGSGTLSATLTSQTADKVLASPSGSSGAPEFISLTASHIPNLPWSKITTGIPTTLAGYGITDAQAKDADLTAIAALIGTGFLQRTGPDTWALVAAPTPAAHEASHRAGGSDQLNLTNIFGGGTTDRPQFAGLTLTAGITFNGDYALSSNSSDGNEQTAISIAGGGAASADRGAFIAVRGNERPSSGGSLTISAGDAGSIQGIIEFKTSDTTRMSITKAGEVNVSSGALRVGSLGGIAAFTGGLFRQAVDGDFPGPLSTMAGLANSRGYMYNSGSGALSWAVAIPGQSFTTLGVTDFGGPGVSGAAWQIGTNYGVGFGDGRGLNWRGGLFNSDAFWGLAQDAGTLTSFKPMVFKDGTGATWYKLDTQDASFKHYFTGNTRMSANVDVMGEIKQGGATAIGISRAGDLNSLALRNLSDGQIPVANSSQILVASGLSDDGTFLGISRVIRVWTSTPRSGNTWTDFQWTQDAQQRVSILSSSGSGAGAYHELVLVPADAEATNRELGFLTYGQKVTGKSGTNPGLKLNIGGKSIGAGGPVGGYGAQFHFEYRPDNAATMATALRIGAFGGSTADAVETAILLRANAGIRDTSLSSGVVKSVAGTLAQAVANTDYLPAANPAMTGIGTYQRLKTGITTVSTSTSTPITTQTNQFINITYTGMATLRLYTPGTDISGIVYKVHCKGCTLLKFTMDTAGSMYYLNNFGGPSNYWYQEAESEHTFITNANSNATCDVWCDGDKWYIRW